MWECRIEGLKELNAALAALPEEASDRILTEALKRAAEPMVVEARMKAPKRAGAHVHMWETIEARAAGITEAGTTVTVAPARRHGFHAQFFEFGTRYQPAIPFLRPAFDAFALPVMQSAGQEILDGITATLRRYVKNARDLGYIS